MKLLDEDHGCAWKGLRVTDKAGAQAGPPQAMLATVARLRAFALLLCLDANLADELVALTLLSKPSTIGLNLSTWLFSQLRSFYYSKFADASGSRETLASAMRLSRQIEHGATLAALAELTAEEREALVLIEAAGCSYDQVARICRCPPVRFNNRVASARLGFARLLSKWNRVPGTDHGYCQFRS